MDIPLEQSIGSVVKYITERDSESIKVYFNNIPDEFAVPSLYFPIPNVESKKVSLSSYVNRISFEVWVMDRSNWEAEARAASLRDALMLDDLLIPILDIDGTATGKGLRIMEPTQRKQETGVVIVAFTIKDYFKAEKNPQKAHDIYYAWHFVTRSQEGRQADGDQDSQEG